MKSSRIYSILLLFEIILNRITLYYALEYGNYISKPSSPLLLSRGNDFINLKLYKGTSSTDFLNHRLQIEKKLRDDEFRGYWDDVDVNYTVSGNTWSLTGLTNKYDYRFRSRIVDPNGTSPWSEPSTSMRVTAFDLLAPVNISVSKIESNAITLEWETATIRNLDSSNHLRYHVQYRQHSYDKQHENDLPWIDYPVSVSPIKYLSKPEIQEITTQVDETSMITNGSFWLQLDLPSNTQGVIGTSFDTPLSKTLSKEIIHNATEEEFMDSISQIWGLSTIRVQRYEPGKTAQSANSSRGAYSWRVEFTTDSHPIPFFVAYKDTLDGNSDTDRIRIKRIFKGTQREFHSKHSIIVSGLDENQVYKFRIRGESACCPGNWKELSTLVRTEISLHFPQNTHVPINRLGKYTKLIPGKGNSPGNQKDPDYIHGVGVGGDIETNGGHGLVVITTFDADVPTKSHSIEFHYIGAPQIFNIPNDYACKHIDIKLWGGGGSGGGLKSNSTLMNSGGGGGFVQSRFLAEKGEKLVIIVGGGGHFYRLDQLGSNSTYFGGKGGTSFMGLDAGQGGGYSAVFKQSGDLLVASGGGGGGGGSSIGRGNAGGNVEDMNQTCLNSHTSFSFEESTCTSDRDHSYLINNYNSPSPGGLGYGGKGSDGEEAGGGGGSGFKGGSGGVAGAGGNGGSSYLNSNYLFDISSDVSINRRLDAPVLLSVRDETISISWSTDPKHYGHTFAIELAEFCSEDFKVVEFVSSMGSFDLNTTLYNLRPNTEYCLRYSKLGQNSVNKLSDALRVKTMPSPKNIWKPIQPIHIVNEETIRFNSTHSYCTSPVKPSFRKGHTMSVLSDRIILFGGFANICTCFDEEKTKSCRKEYIHTNELWIFKNRLWTLLKPHSDHESYPEPREKHSATVLSNGKILIIGGKRKMKRETKFLQDVWQLDIRHGEEWLSNNGHHPLWSRIWSLDDTNNRKSNISFSPRYHHTAIAVNDDVFVFGGYSVQRLHDTWRFNYIDRTWTILNGYKSLTKRWNGQSAAITPFGIVTYGGLKINSDGMTSVEHEMLLYNVLNKTRTKLDKNQMSVEEHDYPEDRHSSSAVFLKSAPTYLHHENAHGLVIFGGERYSPQCLNDMWMLSLEQLVRLTPSPQEKEYACEAILSNNDMSNKWYWTCGDFGGVYSVEKCGVEDVLLMAWCKDQYNSFIPSW